MTHPSPETCRPLLHEALLFWKRSPHDGGANSYFIYNTDGSDVGTVGSDLIAIVKLQSGAARVASNVELALWPDLVRNRERSVILHNRNLDDTLEGRYHDFQ